MKRMFVTVGSDYATSDDPDIVWMAERGRLIHDLWHVLSGYGANEAGESALLAFSAAQTGGRSNRILCFGANAEMIRRHGLRWHWEVITAWNRGRRAVCLHAVPYEDLLDRPLAHVRELLGIDPWPYQP